MNKAMALFAGALLGLSMTSPAPAQTAAPAPTGPSAPADKPSAPNAQVTRQMTAHVVSVNAADKTLTVRRGRRGQPVTLRVEGDAASHLGELKPGDEVTIHYVRVDDQLTAKELVKSEATNQPTK
ncbi:MAG TPA: hypothetical protein VEL75_07865 [Candidatus Methylomirabilis sp.]|nr:hypothetical protein [Candidatus Methylomirabilis sp.]